MRISILSLRTLAYSEDAIRALPFGKKEQARLLAIQNSSRAAASFGALSALHKLIEGQSYPISRQAMGKPYFDVPDAPAFSLSHTDTLAAAVLAEPCEGTVGIDVEDIRPYPHAMRVADRFFTEDEQRRLSQSPTDEAFFSLWTEKEAVAKISGRGLAATLSEPKADIHTKSFRLAGDGINAVLCLAADRPITNVEWLCPTTIQIYER